MAYFTLRKSFYAADAIKYLTFQGNDVDVLTINGNTVLLPLDYTATIPSGSSLTNQTITFPRTKSKLAQGLLLHYHVRKTALTGKASFALTYTDGSFTYTSTIHTINMDVYSSSDLTGDVWYNGGTCELGGGPTLAHWDSAYRGGTYLRLQISGVSNLYLVEPMTIRVVSSWTSREDETAPTMAAAATRDAADSTLGRLSDDYVLRFDGK